MPWWTALRPYRSDDDIPAEVAAVLGCAVLTGGGAVLNAARPRPEDSVMIVGLGGVGMAALITAVSQGISRIVAVDTLDQKLDHARRLGAHETYTPQQVVDGGIKARYVIECAGNAARLRNGLRRDRPRRHHCHRRAAVPRRPRPALAADRHRRSPDDRGQLPWLRCPVAGHPEIRPAVAGRETARRGIDLGRASPWPTSTRPWTSWQTATPSGRSSCSTPASPSTAGRAARQAAWRNFFGLPCMAPESAEISGRNTVAVACPGAPRM